MRAVDQDNDPLVANLICARWRMGPGYWTARHKGATSWLTILTLNGSGRFVHRDGQFDTKPGDIVLMRPKRMHEYGISPGYQEWDLSWAHFHLRPHWVNLLQWSLVGPGMMRESLGGEDLVEAEYAFAQSIEASQTRGRFSDLLALNHLERALILVAARASTAQGPKIDSRVRSVINQMQRDIGSPVSILDLAKMVDLSESRLAHLFTKETGVPPRKYLESLRLERSKQLLELSDLSIREIASSLGFSSEFYFSHRFKAVTGERPSSFRSRLRRD